MQQNQLRPREGSLQIVKRDFDSDNDTVKIYFMNQTFKNIKITPEMTAQEVIEFLIEKLNINDDISNYSLFEDKRTGRKFFMFLNLAGNSFDRIYYFAGRKLARADEKLDWQ